MSFYVFVYNLLSNSKIDWLITIIKNFTPLSFRERSHLGERDRDNCVSSGVELVTTIDRDNWGGERLVVVS